MASIRKAIGDLLVDNGQITPEELEQAEAERAKTGEPIGIPRLLARPTATLSLEAQERRERVQKLYGD